jgi:uroporphyrin-III C-methyltransferase
MRGWVHFTGAGPGDPDLLTLRARRRIDTADLVLYDRLVGERIVATLPAGRSEPAHDRDGSRAGGQERLHARMVDAARSGLCVVRLQGGDPTVFGRLGEEIEHLRRHSVPFEVVPGVTAATAAAAALGVPLTHRGVASGVTLVSGHEAGGGPPHGDWRALAQSDHTLAFYMAGTGAGAIARALMQHGMHPHTPFAVVERVAWYDQHVRRMTLGVAAESLRAGSVRTPAIVVVGQALGQARGAAWAERPVPTCTAGSAATCAGGA